MSIIISLTSIAPRLDASAFGAVCTLLNQTTDVDKVILWLDEALPVTYNLSILRQHALLDIRFRKDIGPYTGLVYALQEFPDAVILHANDDMYYPRDWAERLLVGHGNFPDKIIGNYGLLLCMDDDRFIPLERSPICNGGEIGRNILLAAVCGNLYPPNRLYADATKSEIFMNLCPKQDDLWFWAMAVLNNTDVYVLPDGHRDIHGMAIAKNHKAGGVNLWEYNRRGGSILQLEALVNHYPVLRDHMKQMG